MYQHVIFNVCIIAYFTQKMCLQTQHYDWKNIYNKYYYVYYINLYILLLYYKKNCICLSHFMYFIFILITMIYTDKKYIRLCISSSTTIHKLLLLLLLLLLLHRQVKPQRLRIFVYQLGPIFSQTPVWVKLIINLNESHMIKSINIKIILT